MTDTDNTNRHPLHAERTASGPDWTRAHNQAIAPYNTRRFEHAITAMLTAWREYARDHRAQFETPIGEDYVLGPAWREIGANIRQLLNGELGRLDGGTLDGFILSTMTTEGIDTTEL